MPPKGRGDRGPGAGTLGRFLAIGLGIAFLLAALSPHSASAGALPAQCAAHEAALAAGTADACPPGAATHICVSHAGHSLCVPFLAASAAFFLFDHPDGDSWSSRRADLGNDVSSAPDAPPPKSA